MASVAFQNQSKSINEGRESSNVLTLQSADKDCGRIEDGAIDAVREVYAACAFVVGDEHTRGRRIAQEDTFPLGGGGVGEGEAEVDVMPLRAETP